MTTPRHTLVDSAAPCFYHLVSRCVRRSWLCGKDRRSRRNYEHRRQWLVDRLHQLSRAYAIELHAYAIMSNHFHLVIYYDPNAAAGWSDDELADRWIAASPPRTKDGQIDHGAAALQRTDIMADRQQLERIRRQLGSLSRFMKHLKQPIARRANIEDGCTGHFFEQRFYSGALLTEDAVLAAMAYVDLNPIRSRIAESITASQYTSAAERIDQANGHPKLLEAYLAPLASGLTESAGIVLTLSLSNYLSHLDQLKGSAEGSSQRVRADKIEKWRQRIAILAKRQRVFGTSELVREWLSARGLQMREVPLS